MKIFILFLCIVFSTIVLNSCNKVCPYIHNHIDSLEMHINDGLWAYYPVNGNLDDSSGNHHTLLLNKTATLTTDMQGNENSAINFDGFTSYGIIEDGGLFTSQDFSISMFVMPRQDEGLFFGKQDYNTAEGATFNVGFDNVYYGDNARFSITKNQSNICNEYANGSFLCLNPQPFQLNTWYHVVITYSKGIMKMYINGQVVSTASLEKPLLTYCSAAPFILGTWWAQGQNTFDGKMDNLRIYTRALSGEEIYYLYKKN